MKDDKFPAAPTADEAADSKVHNTPGKVTTTESLNAKPEEVKDTEKHVKDAKGSDEQKMYAAYVKGDSVQSIADSFKVEAHVVLSAVQAIEADRK